MRRDFKKLVVIGIVLLLFALGWAQPVISWAAEFFGSFFADQITENIGNSPSPEP